MSCMFATQITRARVLGLRGASFYVEHVHHNISPQPHGKTEMPLGWGYRRGVMP